MKGQKNWRQQDEKFLISARRKGMSYKVIATYLGRTPASCYNKSIYIGLEEEIRKKNQAHREAEIKSLLDQGKTRKEIADIFKVHTNTVYKWISKIKKSDKTEQPHKQSKHTCNAKEALAKVEQLKIKAKNRK